MPASTLGIQHENCEITNTSSKLCSLLQNVFSSCILPQWHRLLQVIQFHSCFFSNLKMYFFPESAFISHHYFSPLSSFMMPLFIMKQQSVKSDLFCLTDRQRLHDKVKLFWNNAWWLFYLLLLIKPIILCVCVFFHSVWCLCCDDMLSCPHFQRSDWGGRWFKKKQKTSTTGCT